MTGRQPGTQPLGWAARVIPAALLIVLALAGLRGAIAAPRWDGPLHRAGLVIGAALVAVLITLLVITWIRRRAALAAGGADRALDVPAKLRLALTWLLGTGIVAAITTMLIAAHLHLFKARAQRPRSLPQRNRLLTPPSSRPVKPASGLFAIPFSEIFYGLLVLALILAVVVAIRWSAGLRPPVRLGEDLAEDEDSQNLREAVESGRSALRTLDDARAAIIACYVAMEQSLAERGAARGTAGTPDELLTRATQSKIVHGTAAARLTALFYEARFSSHPMDQGQRQAAEQALDELASALAASV